MRSGYGAWAFLVAGVICILVHFAFIIAGARIFRIDVSMAAVASSGSSHSRSEGSVSGGTER